MASPEELVPLLPETLPEDFSEWDSEAASAPLPATAGEWEAWAAAHSLGETPKASLQNAGREEILASLTDRPRVWNSASSKPIFVEQQSDLNEWVGEASPAPAPDKANEWEAWEAAHSFGKNPKRPVQPANREAILPLGADKPRVSNPPTSAPVPGMPQEASSKPAIGSPGRVTPGLEARHATNDAPLAPGLSKIPAADGKIDSPAPPSTSKREDDAALFQLFSAKNDEIPIEQKKGAKKKWMTIGGVSAGAILLPLIMFPMLHHGNKPAAKQSVQPVPEATDTQVETQPPDAATGESPTQDVAPPATAKPETNDNHPAAKNGGMNSAQAPTRVQAKMMNEQLTAPTQIPQGTEKQMADNAPPPVSFDATGADGLGGTSAGASVFSGQTQPDLSVVASKRFVISSGVATGMLIQKTPPLYPSIAKAARVSGTVVLHATISKNGTIKGLQVVSGPEMLRQAAIDAVRTWRYKPYKLNNEPTEVDTSISVVFALSK